MKRKIIVVTAAYGHQQIAQWGGQAALIPIITAAGADGIEIRRELFSANELHQLPALQQRIADHGLTSWYSIPEPLFDKQGAVNARLAHFIDEAEQLQACGIKFSPGHYHARSDCYTLIAQLRQTNVMLLVENDQTERGCLKAMEYWCHQQGAHPLTNALAFDMGNWLWVGDDPLQAAERLAKKVRYIHVKAAISQGDRWRAIALDDADNLWCETLNRLPGNVPRGIEFPLEGDDLIAVTRHYVELLREDAPQ